MQGRKFKVAFFITRSDVIGGASIHLLDLARELVSRRHEVVIFVGGKGVFQELVEKEGLECDSLKYLVRQVNPIKDLFAFFEIRKKIKEASPDIVHLHSSKAGIIGRLSCIGINVPVVFTAHGWSFTEGVSFLKRNLYRTIELVCARFTTMFITVSDYDKRLGISSGVCRNENVITIHNGIRTSSFCSSQKKSYQVPLNLVMVARFDEPKDHETLLRSLARLDPSTWKLSLVGAGALESKIRLLADKLQIGNSIKFLGERKDIPNILKEADAFCLVSNWEGFPISILEAMAARLPVVASNVGGVSEAVSDGYTGILVKRGDVVGLSEAFKSLINDRELAMQMGLAGQKRVNEFFTTVHMVDKVENLYCQISK